MTDDSWTFTAELWQSESVASWVFVTLPDDVSEDVRLLSGPPSGFGSVRVEVTLGDQRWRTSVFPEKAGSYVLPVKAAVRRRAGMDIGEQVELTIALIRDA
ncbi:MAG TPA: DUF1905 domain-containing protein [Nocardioides sp.]|uniref:DUF1905 domain-containing protein n=1 Tax=uncultured Nocardioides sp. TaxID=198441 RepID=UPI000ED06D56|nr:DUF1905 domain-containing protein [uncultured Nocardioides sp.]HCB06070.1 DUF1905 domain-containing protein [Nocardioides sp.]HRD60557.1 DUF1905 domain-containing protein [Nocardioides sp.]HRI95747.1 DUF1905 domain-containing protein [Nocardioides sp.]HRK45845.1 DUF1905 domain-containing protein [Nocardioides sp.]